MSSLSYASTSLSDIDLSPLNVYDALSNCDPAKAIGIDGVEPNVLKFCACALS